MFQGITCSPIHIVHCSVATVFTRAIEQNCKKLDMCLLNWGGLCPQFPLVENYSKQVFSHFFSPLPHHPSLLCCIFRKILTKLIASQALHKLLKKRPQRVLDYFVVLLPHNILELIFASKNSNRVFLILFLARKFKLSFGRWFQAFWNFGHF